MTNYANKWRCSCGDAATHQDSLQAGTSESSSLPPADELKLMRFDHLYRLNKNEISEKVIAPNAPMFLYWDTARSAALNDISDAIIIERAKMQEKLASLERTCANWEKAAGEAMRQNFARWEMIDKMQKRLAEAAIKLMATEEGKAKAEMRVLELEGKLTKAQEPLTAQELLEILNAWLARNQLCANFLEYGSMTAEAQRKKAMQ